jgi:hypothetical protein
MAIPKFSSKSFKQEVASGHGRVVLVILYGTQ